MVTDDEAARLEGLRDAFAAQAGLVVRALDAAGADEPTRCAGWTVADLDRHLGSVTGGLARLLARPVDGPADTTISGWARALPGLSSVVDADARAAGPGLGPAVGALTAALGRADPHAVVQQATGRHGVADALLFRLVETVVHGLDLPIPVRPSPEALSVVVRTFADLLAEKAPGCNVEVRVDGLARIMVSAAARPSSNLPVAVDAGAVPFIDLCSGRLAWPPPWGRGSSRSWAAPPTSARSCL